MSPTIFGFPHPRVTDFDRLVHFRPEDVARWGRVSSRLGPYACAVELRDGRALVVKIDQPSDEARALVCDESLRDRRIGLVRPPRPPADVSFELALVLDGERLRLLREALGEAICGREALGGDASALREILAALAPVRRLVEDADFS